MSLVKKISKLDLKSVIILALLLRLVIAPLAEHGDVINYYYWSKDLLVNGLLGFYERQIPNAMRPTYPPVTSYIFWLSATLHELLWNVSWFINKNVPVFPSNFIFWLESPKGWYFVNKLPGVLADIGIIYVIFKFVKRLKNEKKAILASTLFAFTPAFWYNSALWGQTDSVFALFMILSFYLLYKKKNVSGAVMYLISILTKPTALFVLPVFALWLIKKSTFRELTKISILSIAIIFLFYYPFHPEGTLIWIYDFYKRSLGGELDYIVANSFNLWGLIWGFGDVSEKSAVLGISSHLLGYILFTLLTIPLMAFLILRKNLKIFIVLLLSVIVSYTAFMFLPRMHERYFYPTLLLMIPLAIYERKLLKVFILASIVHLINLYHFWWVPRVDILITVFTNRFVEIFLIILNISLYAWLIRYFKIKENEK